jgi:hypothetical protein
LSEGLAAAAAAGAIGDMPIDAAAALLSACYDRAALAVEAGAEEGAWLDIIDRFVNGLLT